MKPLDAASSNVVDPFSQDFDFVNNLPPLDAFDTILWYVIQDLNLEGFL